MATTKYDSDYTAAGWFDPLLSAEGWFDEELIPSPPGTTVTPGTLALALVTFAAVVTITANVLVTPATAALSLSSFAPTVTASNHQTVTPSTTALTLATFAPSIGIGVNVVPSTAALTTTGFAPSVTTTAHQTVTPSTAALSTALFAPTVTASNHQTVIPGTLALVTGTFAPSVTITNNQVVTPDTASLTIAAFAPSVNTDFVLSLTAAQAINLEAIFRLHGLIDPLVITPTSRGDGTVTQTLSGTTSVLVTTTGLPASGTPTGALVDKLARLYGIIDPLTVTATNRGDGTISQSIVEVGGDITLTTLP